MNCVLTDLTIVIIFTIQARTIMTPLCVPLVGHDYLKQVDAYTASRSIRARFVRFLLLNVYSYV
jgi:hypothetical protein